MNKTIVIKLILICFFCLPLPACRLAKLLKADPAPSSGFIDKSVELMPWEERVEFLQGVWYKDVEKLYRERGKYKKIYFKPVRTDFLLNRGWWTELNTVDREEYERDLAMIATYIKETFDSKFTEDPKKHFEVVQTASPSTLVYEIALVELVATKAHVNAIGTALGLVVPGGGLIKSFASGSIAIEVKVYDGETNELLIAWADREKDQIAPVSINEYSWYSNAKKAVDNWAEALVEVYNTPRDTKVGDRSPITLNPF